MTDKLTAIERLEALLNDKDAECEELREELQATETLLEQARDREVPDDGILPVPRLELAWTSDEPGNWSRYKVEYRLVMVHLTGPLTVIPLGMTTVTSGDPERAPYEQHPINLPFRDGVHAHHDAAHLGIPLYAVTPGGAMRLDVPGHRYPDQALKGQKHRRTP